MSQLFRRSSSTNQETDLSRKAKRFTGETSNYTNNITRTVSFNSSTPSKATSNQGMSTSTFHPKKKGTLTTIHEDFYIKGHIMLPNSRVVSILMKRGEPLSEYLAETYQETETCAEKEPVLYLTHSGSKSDYSNVQDGHCMQNISEEIQHHLCEHVNDISKRNTKQQYEEDTFENNTGDVFAKRKSRGYNDGKSTHPEEENNEPSKSEMHVLRRDKQSQPCVPSDPQTVVGYESHPFRFNLPTLPRLNQKSVSFKLNTAIIRPRECEEREAIQPGENSKTLQPREKEVTENIDRREYKNTHASQPRKPKARQTDRRHRHYMLRRMTDKERANDSALRYPGFITIENERIGTKNAEPLRDEINERSNDIPAKDESTPPLKYKMVDKAISPMSVPTVVEHTSRANKQRRTMHHACATGPSAIIQNITRPSQPAEVHISAPSIQAKDGGGIVESVLPVKKGRLNKIGTSFRGSLERQIQRRLQNKIPRPATDDRRLETPIRRHDRISPSGRTKNYVRFYESNRLPQPYSTKYNFQVLRRRFESCSNPVKNLPGNAGATFNVSNLHKNFSVNSKLVKQICREKSEEKCDFNPNKGDRQENMNGRKERTIEQSGALNRMIEDIVNKVDEATSRKSLIPRSKSRRLHDKTNDQKNLNVHMSTMYDSEFKQLQHIFKTVKRNWNKQVLQKVRASSSVKLPHNASVEDYLSNIGQHLCRIYLKSFRKNDPAAYGQNDFVNIRKVVYFFLSYLLVEHKYARLSLNVSMANLLYSVFERMSQHHYRLKHHLRTSLDKDSTNTPWPATVYDELRKFNMIVNSRSHKNYTVSTTRLRQSASSHSEHSIKYFAIDYFLKLLKIIFIETRDKELRTKETDISYKATVSSFNSHQLQYCSLQSGDSLSMNAIAPPAPPPPTLPCVSAPHETSCADEYYENTSAESGEESAVQHPREIRIRNKHRRCRRRKARPTFIWKQTRNASPKANILDKFEINKAIVRSSFKENVTSQSKFPVEFPHNSETIPKNLSSPTKSKEQNKVEDNVHFNDIGHQTKSEPIRKQTAPPVKFSKGIQSNDAEIMSEVSHLVGQIVSQQSKQFEQIKEKINAVLRRNIVQINAINKQYENNATTTKALTFKNVEKEREEIGVHNTRKVTILNCKGSNSKRKKQGSLTSRSLVIQHVKKVLEDLKYHQDVQTLRSVQEPGLLVKEVLKRGSDMIPVNMIKNPHQEKPRLRHVALNPISEDLCLEETNKDFKSAGKSCVRDERNKSVSCENRRNKVISKKINQKIMELTKKFPLGIPKPMVTQDDKLTENNVHPPKPPPVEGLIKNMKQQNKPCCGKSINSPEHKAKEIVGVEENHYPGRKETQISTQPNQKTLLISNDELFFPIRRNLSLFKRPFQSMMDFDSDPLSGRDTDDDFSIHELFKKPYHRNESNSFTDHLHHEAAPRVDKAARKRALTKLESKDKCLTKKQLEVFDKWRSMYHMEQTAGAGRSPQVDKMPEFYDLESYLSQLVVDVNRDKRRGQAGKRSRSEDCDKSESSGNVQQTRSSETIK